MSSILIAYATRYGSTKEVAERVGGELSARGATVTVQPARDVVSLDDADAVVLATPFYIGSMLKDASGFLSRHQESLSARPVALLALGPIAATDDMEEARKQLAQALDKVPWLRPVSAEMFVGSYDPSRLRGMDKLVATLPVSPLKGAPARDDRDWDAISAWTAQLATTLSA